MRDFLNILKHAFSYKIYALLNIVFNIVSAVSGLLSLLLFIPFLRLLFKEEPIVIVERPEFALNKDYFDQLFQHWMTSYAGNTGKLEVLQFICISIIVLFFVKNITRYFAMYFLAKVRTGVVRDIRNTMHKKLLNLHVGYFSEERKGDLMARLSNDVVEVEVSVMSSLEMLFRDPFSIVIFLTFMIGISGQLTLISFIFLPIGALVIGVLSKSLKRTSTKVQDRLGGLIVMLEESLSGIKLIQAFRGERARQQAFEASNSAFRRTQTRAYRKRDLASPLSEFLGACVMVGIVWFGGRLILDGGDHALSGEEFIGFILLFSQLLRPVQAISNAISNISKGMASVERINGILKEQTKIQDHPQAVQKKELEQGVNLEQVSFSYSEREVLSDINLSIEKGKTIALVGESGGGKSTLADLIPRFYDCTRGQITLDGINIKEIYLEDLRGLMGIVSQHAVLFNDTIFNNIAFGLDATQEEVGAAARIANAHDFILKQEQGYQTNVGDGGNKLSGGQRQRVSIARAVLKNPPLLILDEATSALDTESEKLVQEALEKLMENRTTLVIAHRLSTIQHADEIVVLQEGRICERGNHEQLLESGGIYKRLVDLQTFA